MIGLLIGLTPTVGIQMWIVSSIWLVCRYVFHFRFNLVVGNAMVWISNPLTMGPMYYVFLITGSHFFTLIGYAWPKISYAHFQQSFSDILSTPEASQWDIFLKASKYMFVDLGYPMVIGSFLYAIPISIASFFITRKYLLRYRVKQANKMGMEYEEWRERFEVKE